MITKKIIIDNIKTIFYALVIAIVIRSLFIQPFYIPSSSMEPTLLIGDRLFVTKYSYGYSKHSFPFSPPIISGRLFSKKPKVDPLTYCALKLADDVAYGTGVWKGVIATRDLGALAPKFD